MLLLIRRRAMTRAGYSTPAGTASLASPYLTTTHNTTTPTTSQPTRLVHFPGSSTVAAGRLLQKLGSLGYRRRAGIYSSNYRSWR